MQCACAVLCCHLWPIRLYYISLHYLINATIAGKKTKAIAHKMCLIFSTTFVWNISHYKKNWTRYYKNIPWTSCTVTVVLKLDFLYRFFFNLNISNFMKIRPLGGELVHSDRRTDMTKLIVAVRNFAKTPKEFCINPPPASDTHLPSPNNPTVI